MDPYRLPGGRLRLRIWLPSQALEKGDTAFCTEEPQRKHDHEQEYREREGRTVQSEEHPVAPATLQDASVHVEALRGAAATFSITACAT